MVKLNGTEIAHFFSDLIIEGVLCFLEKVRSRQYCFLSSW